MLLQGKISSMRTIAFKWMMHRKDHQFLVIMRKYIVQCSKYFCFGFVFTITFYTRLIIFVQPPLRIHYYQLHIFTDSHLYRAGTTISWQMPDIFITKDVYVRLHPQNRFIAYSSSIGPIMITRNKKHFGPSSFCNNDLRIQRCFGNSICWHCFIRQARLIKIVSQVHYCGFFIQRHVFSHS